MKSRKIINIVLLLLPVVLTVLFIDSFGSNLIMNDNWDFVGQARELEAGNLDIGGLFEQYSVHRAFFPRLYTAVIYAVTQFDQRAVFFLSLWTFLLSYLILYKKISKSNGFTLATVPLWFILVPFIVFSCTQVQVLLWCVTYAFTTTFALAAFYLLDRILQEEEKLASWKRGFAFFFAIGASIIARVFTDSREGAVAFAGIFVTSPIWLHIGEFNTLSWGFALGLVAAALSVRWFDRGGWKNVILAGLGLGFALAVYQALFILSLTALLIVCVRKVWDGAGLFRGGSAVCLTAAVAVGLAVLAYGGINLLLQRLAGEASSYVNSFNNLALYANGGAGALAGKVSGAGGGGFMMFFVPPERRMDVIQTLSGYDGSISNCHFTSHGTQAWKV